MLILPDRVTLTPEAARRVDEYVRGGGKLLLSGDSALGPDGDFQLACLPVRYLGPGLTAPRYMDIREGVFPGVPAMKTVAYSGGARVSAKPGAQVLSETVDSYFNRSEAHFCSHRQTPPQPRGAGEPCVVLGENVAYVSNVLFRDLAEYGVKAYKDILSGLIGRLIDRPLVKSDLPAYAEVTLRRQGGDLIVHVLNYLVQRKCRQLDTVEDVVPLYQRCLRVFTGERPLSVSLLPEEAPLPFEFEDGYAVLRPDCLKGRTMFKIELP